MSEPPSEPPPVGEQDLTEDYVLALFWFLRQHGITPGGAMTLFCTIIAD